MEQKLTYIVEGMLTVTIMFSAILAVYVMLTVSSMPYRQPQSALTDAGDLM